MDGEEQTSTSSSSTSVSIGEELKLARASLGQSIEDVESYLRIKSTYLKAIEDCDRSRLPDDVYTDGFVRAYAGYLGLDRVETLRRFHAEAGETLPPPGAGGFVAGSRLTRKFTSKTPNVKPTTVDPLAGVPPIGNTSTASAGFGLGRLAALLPLLLIGAIGYGLWYGIKVGREAGYLPNNLDVATAVGREPAEEFEAELATVENNAGSETGLERPDSLTYASSENSPYWQGASREEVGLDPPISSLSVNGTAVTGSAESNLVLEVASSQNGGLSGQNGNELRVSRAGTLDVPNQETVAVGNGSIGSISTSGEELAALARDALAVSNSSAGSLGETISSGGAAAISAAISENLTAEQSSSTETEIMVEEEETLPDPADFRPSFAPLPRPSPIPVFDGSIQVSGSISSASLSNSDDQDFIIGYQTFDAPLQSGPVTIQPVTVQNSVSNSTSVNNLNSSSNLRAGSNLSAEQSGGTVQNGQNVNVAAISNAGTTQRVVSPGSAALANGLATEAVRLTALTDTSLVLRDPQGAVVYRGVVSAGESVQPSLYGASTVSVSDGGALSGRVGTVQLGSFGSTGIPAEGIALDPAELLSNYGSFTQQ